MQRIGNVYKQPSFHRVKLCFRERPNANAVHRYYIEWMPIRSLYLRGSSSQANQTIYRIYQIKIINKTDTYAKATVSQHTGKHRTK